MEGRTMNRNPNCCGAHCVQEHGEVRVYPIGAGGNLILCRACWNFENAYNAHRNQNDPGNWFEHDWQTAERYLTESAS